MKRFKSIQSTLLGWFLLISLIPMGMIGWYGYRAAVTSIVEVQNSELDTTAKANVQLVDEWFTEIRRDLNAWATLPAPNRSFNAIVQGWDHEHQTLKSYVQSDRYQKEIEYGQTALETLQRSYDYAYDILMIDMDGNILFSVKKEDDFISNLRFGKYANTLFARAYRQTLLDGKNHFSDLEYYEASGGMLSGFVTAPMKNHGKIIGVMALQLNIDSMLRRLGKKSGSHSTIRHYLVGEDGLLRSKRNDHEILNERISTELFWAWNNHDEVLHDTQGQYMLGDTLPYIGPDGEEVVGKHYDIDIMGVRWIHISEISVQDAQKASERLAQTIVLMMLFGVGVIIIAARLLSRRITDPIIALREASRAYERGEEDIELFISGENEITELATAFSSMVHTQNLSAKAVAEMAERERKRSLELEQLLTQTLRLSQVVGQSPYPIIITDTQGIMEYVNDELLKQSGYLLDELIGQKISIFRSCTHNDGMYQALWQRIGVKREVWHGTLIDRMKNGQLRDWDSTIFPLFDVKGNVINYVSIVKDVTELNAKERLMMIQSRQAQMGEMLSMIAHQWRQPLAIINALVGKILLQEMFKEQPDEGLNDVLKQIEDQSLFLSRTITDFRDFFRTDKPKEFVKCSILIRDTIRLIDHAVKTHSLHFNLDVRNDPEINTYANEILQVLITLIKNSIDAFDEHPIKDKKVDLTIDCDETWAIITIEDNAGGIASEIIGEIFSPYFTTKVGDKGTGLGLYMAKMVVEEHCHGKLEVSSEGENTLFRILLPLG